MTFHSKMSAPTLGFRLSAHARCLRHFKVATPNRETNIPFLSTRNTNFDFWTNAWSFFLLGVASLECVRHQTRWFILTVRKKYRARCLTHSRVATPNRGTNMPFLSKRNTNLDYAKNA